MLLISYNTLLQKSSDL